MAHTPDPLCKPVSNTELDTGDAPYSLRLLVQSSSCPYGRTRSGNGDWAGWPAGEPVLCADRNPVSLASFKLESSQKMKEIISWLGRTQASGK